VFGVKAFIWVFLRDCPQQPDFFVPNGLRQSVTIDFAPLPHEEGACVDSYAGDRRNFVALLSAVIRHIGFQ
jgi:hypothetical protein